MHLAKHTPRSDIHQAQLQPGVRFGFMVPKINTNDLQLHTSPSPLLAREGRGASYMPG